MSAPAVEPASAEHPLGVAEATLTASHRPTDLLLALHRGVQALGLPLGEEVESQLWAYLQLIAKWNRVYNLTAVREPGEMLTHHILDSLSVVSAAALALKDMTGAVPEGQPLHLLDVGSGAGLPGLALALALPSVGCPSVRVSCVDAVSKKVGFIQQAAAELGLMSRVQARHGRIESLTLPQAHLITCRAFSSLADWVFLTEQHLAPGGVWMAMKGQIPEEEIKALPSTVEVFHVEPLRVPYLDAQRCLVWIRRRSVATSPTP